MNRCGATQCYFPSCGCMRQINHDSHAERLALRQKLIAELEQIAEKAGLNKRNVARKIGLHEAQYNRIINGEGGQVTVDSLALYISRLSGMKVGFYLYVDDEDDSDDTSTVCVD